MNAMHEWHAARVTLFVGRKPTDVGTVLRMTAARFAQIKSLGLDFMTGVVSEGISESRFEHGRTLDELLVEAGQSAIEPSFVAAIMAPELARQRLDRLEMGSGMDPVGLATAREAGALIPCTRSQGDVGYVYFMAAPAFGRVKIGFTRDVQRRISSIQNAAPCEVVHLGSVRALPAAETALLYHLGDHRIRGEWFHATPRVLGAVSTAMCLPTRVLP